jgi:hypothetical protein
MLGHLHRSAARFSGTPRPQTLAPSPYQFLRLQMWLSLMAFPLDGKSKTALRFESGFKYFPALVATPNFRAFEVIPLELSLSHGSQNIFPQFP